MFPIVGSAFLFSLYLLFKFLSADLVNLLLSTYFMILGIGAVNTVLSPFVKHLIPYKWVKKQPFVLKFEFPYFEGKK